MSLLERLDAAGPKRILALDGGGIRGALTLGYLERLEAILRDRHARPDLRLADYFDLIGGTSTGAIIAAGLAIGMSASEITSVYLEFGREVFGQKQGLGFLRGAFRKEPLERKLRDFFGDIHLDSDRIRTGLCIVVKRCDTNSTWPLINHPRGRYFSFNRSLRLREVIRASTAAPTFFDPERLSFGGEAGFERGRFVDGGVSMHNNPALLLFLVATLRGFPFRWPTGEDRLMLVSVGTGYWYTRTPIDGPAQNTILEWSRVVPGMLVQDATWLNQTVLQAFSRSPTAVVIDREMGDLGDDLIGGRPLLWYLRYNAALEVETLEGLGFPQLVGRLDDLRDMTDAGRREDLYGIGTAAAAIQVSADHFPAAFDLA
jgi:hypothetical protein